MDILLFGVTVAIQIAALSKCYEALIATESHCVDERITCTFQHELHCKDAMTVQLRAALLHFRPSSLQCVFSSCSDCCPHCYIPVQQEQLQLLQQGCKGRASCLVQVHQDSVSCGLLGRRSSQALVLDYLCHTEKEDTSQKMAQDASRVTEGLRESTEETSTHEATSTQDHQHTPTEQRTNYELTTSAYRPEDKVSPSPNSDEVEEVKSSGGRRDNSSGEKKLQASDLAAYVVESLVGATILLICLSILFCCKGRVFKRNGPTISAEHNTEEDSNRASAAMSGHQGNRKTRNDYEAHPSDETQNPSYENCALDDESSV